jgi:tetratricopeptide (TPR) repeat protein
MAAKTKHAAVRKKRAPFITWTPKQMSTIMDLTNKLVVNKETGLLFVELYKHLCDVIPDNYVLHFYLGGHLFFAEKYAESLKVYEKAQKLNPKDPWIYNQLGLGYALVGKFDKALANIEKGVKMDPSNTYIVSSHYEIYALMNDYDKAREVLKKELKSGKIPLKKFCQGQKDYLKSRFCQDWEKKVLTHLVDDFCSSKI